MKVLSLRFARFIALAASVAVLGALLVPLPQAAVAGPSLVTQTFSYTGSVSYFTVPAGISSLEVTVTGGQGGNGGADATPAPPAGGYRGVVTGTISVTPGQVLTMGVGRGGATGQNRTNANSGNAAAGSNPIFGYAGGRGGAAGTQGKSGMGGAGGAATVVQLSGNSVVAGGGGGNGGSGQYASTQGRTATASYLGRTDTVTGTGQDGVNANDACIKTSCSNNDGGGSGGGGGGSLGGAQGAIEFGAGTSNEWFGYAGSVGQNSTASISGLSASYQYYSTNGAAGSVVISYSTGAPAAPSAVSGTAADGAVGLLWTAPTDRGQSVISNYVAQYSSNDGTSWSGPVDLGTIGTSGTVTGLSNGTAYIFQVAAVNSVGTGIYSASSSVTPLGPPTAPTISSVTAQDGALSLTLAAPSSGAPVTGYDYRLNGGPWIAVASPSTSLIIPGLINGTTYTVEVRAESSGGAGAVSSPASGTPLAVPGAPTISSLAAGKGSLSVAFTPGFSGGGAITSYEFQLNDDPNWKTASGTSSPISITGLAAGTTYSVALRAVNSVGAGAPSTPASATTPALPGAPTISVVAGDGTARVSFIPGATGGSPIQSYEFQTTATGAWAVVPGASSPVLIGGLTNGAQYDVSIRAINSVGEGDASASVAVIPATIPGAPSINGETVAGSDATLSAAFTGPSNNGGSDITNYQYSTDAGATWRVRADSVGASSPVVIKTASSDGTTLLTNGVTYYVELRAVNAIGAGTASAVASGIATTFPSKPTITKVTPSNGSLGVDFTAGSNGGSAITGYQYSVDGGSSWVSTGTGGTSFVIGDLNNGTEYPVQLRAINSVGEGVVSAAVTATPVRLPGQASISGVVRSNQKLTAAVGLADNGGSPVTSWQYSTDGGAKWSTASGTASPLILTVLSSDGTTLLANGTGYALQVRAVTAVGAGPASASTFVSPASAPAAPSIEVTADNASMSVNFALGTDGGSPVTELKYSLDGGASWTSTGTLSNPFTIGGLANGTSYDVQLRADNAIGAGTSSVIASTTPRTVPGAPSAVVAASNSALADVTWAAPAVTGGAPVTGYTVAAYTTSTGTTAFSTCSTSGATTCSLTGLINETAYYVGVAAINSAGTGAASTPRVLVTPLARPGGPTLNSFTVGDGSISATFTAGSAGDRSITGYQYSVDGGTTWAIASGTSTPIMITGLTNGTTYTVALRAVSSAGVGATSNTKQATPFTYPSLPDTATIVANGGNGQITVSWEAANLNGGTLQNYTATAFTALNSGTSAESCTTTGLSCIIPKLSNGTTYYVSLQTQNTASMYSARSAPRVAATPSKPGAATDVTATAGDATAAVSWTPPMSTGASAITGYTLWYSTNGGAYAQYTTTTTTSAEVVGLTNGSVYTFTVFTTNSDSTGPISAASSAVTPLVVGTAPVLAVPTPTASGFTSTITNYDTATSYSATATNGATVVLNGSTITVSSLSNGATSSVTVEATKPATTTTTVSLAGAALLTGIAPTFSGNVATATGFGFTITNYDSAVTYTLTAGGGATATRSGAAVTVTGLALDDSSAVTVLVAKSGSTSASAINSGAAMVAGTAPTFTDLVPTETGYQVDIANYSSALDYTVGATSGATATRSGSTITVTGLSDGAAADVTITATDPGVSVATATQSGAALLAGTVPTVSTVTQTIDGFSFTITNPNLTAAYSVTTTAGLVVLSGTTFTVTGLAASLSAEVTLITERSGYTTKTATFTGRALGAGADLAVSSPLRTLDGYTFTLTNFDNVFTWGATSTAGAVTIGNGLVTVTGLNAGQSATVTIVAAKVGDRHVQVDVIGAAITTGTSIALSSPTSVKAGFTAKISNFDLGSSYGATVSAGQVTINGSTVVVSDLAAGVAAMITITATKAGFTTVSAQLAGVALPASLPVPPVVAPATDKLDRGPKISDTTPPMTPGVDPGIGVVLIGDKTVPATLTSSPVGRTLTSGSLSMTISSDGDKPTMKYLAVEGGSTLRVSVDGFLPTTELVVWVFSTPVRVSNATVISNQSAQVSFVLPASIKSGNHTLIASGTSAVGDQVTLKIGFVVTAQTTTSIDSAVTQPAASLATPGHQSVFWSWGWLVILASLVLLLALVFILFRHRLSTTNRRNSDVDATRFVEY